ASPMMALACVPAVEAWLGTRERKPALAGMAAGAMVVALQAILPAAGASGSASPGAAWLLVAAYALLAGFRYLTAARSESAGRDRSSLALVAELTRGVVVELDLD